MAAKLHSDGTGIDNEPCAALPCGQMERGSALQRHLAREISALPGIEIATSLSSGTIRTAVTDTHEIRDLLALGEKYGFEVSLGNIGAYEHSGQVDIRLTERER